MKYKKILEYMDKIFGIADVNLEKNPFCKKSDILNFYFKEIINEIGETKEEFKNSNVVYLEDECGDVFYDYIMILKLLERDGYIRSMENVFEHSLQKFSERYEMFKYKTEEEQQKYWNEIKKKQKIKLTEEHNKIYGKK